jgi:hypothetical protein
MEFMFCICANSETAQMKNQKFVSWEPFCKVELLQTYIGFDATHKTRIGHADREAERKRERKRKRRYATKIVLMLLLAYNII